MPQDLRFILASIIYLLSMLLLGQNSRYGIPAMLFARAKLTSGAAQNEYCLRRVDDTLIPKTLLAIQQINVSTVLAMMFSDGSVEFRDRTTMQILSPDENEDQISSLYQIGFNFLGARPCKSPFRMSRTNELDLILRFSGLHAALSPNVAALLVLDDQHIPTLNVMQYLKLMSPDAMTDSQSSKKYISSTSLTSI